MNWFLAKMPSLLAKKHKRRGRGYSSGKGGHASGRGSKGTKARSKVSVIFTGSKHKKSLWQRLPILRGKNKAIVNKNKILAINISRLIPFITKNDQVIDGKFLVDNKIIKPSQANLAIKIIGKQKLTKKIILKVPASHKLAARLTIAKMSQTPVSKGKASKKLGKKEK